MKYADLVIIELSHDYYQSGQCPCFDVVPTAATTRVLNGLRAGFSASGALGKVSIRVNDDNTPFINSPRPVTLEFEMRFNNADKREEFMGMTDLSEMQKLQAPTFRNTGLEGNGQLSLGDSDNALSPNVTAKIELVLSLADMDLAAGPVTYQVSYSASEKLWEYCVLTNLNHDSTAFKIEDNSTVPNENDNQISFASLNAEGVTQGMRSDIATELQNQYPDCKLLHFVSSQAIKDRQYVRDNIQFVVGDDIALEYLPNPLLKNSSVVISESDGQTHASMFQVVKYITHTLSTNGN
ncbi:MAG: hypothetical protein COA42_04980 [Alteromonadaceae bacterium]|nr:MAG: hypothetical protein COA42_04980 [Alteromonadaceae bacterium]